MYFCKKMYQVFFILLISAVFVSPGLAGENVARKSYRIGAGDVLNINVWKEPDLSFDSGKRLYP